MRVADKQQAYNLIDRLPPSELETVVRFLQFLLMDPVARAMATAPVDDEPVTEKDIDDPARVDAWYQERGGKGILMEEVLADFGLTRKDFPLDRHAG